MNFDSLENLTKKHSRWTDAIKRDSKYCGIGTVNNRVKIQHGQILEQPCEDRSFSFELKDGEIYAYAVIDGFNGTWVVDFLEQFLLSNLYFDHLSDLSIKSNEEINELLIKEFSDAEIYLSEQSHETLAKRASINILLANLNKRCAEYSEKNQELKRLNDDLTIGAYAVVSLIVNDRLFVTNLGTSHCFVCVYDKSNREKKVITLETEHSLRNLNEIQRIVNLKADVQENDYGSSPSIKHTRCFGDFYSKIFFFENQQFDSCEESPIISSPEHPEASIVIDDSFLFMAMFSDGLVKAIESIDGQDCNANSVLALKIISKITSEQTLNSAAQSVLDEIKRSFDDKFEQSLSQREDFTLVIRVFDTNIKTKLNSLENQSRLTTNEIKFKQIQINDSENEDLDELQGLDLRTSIVKTNQTRSSLELSRASSQVSDHFSNFLDDKNNAIPYLSFEEFNEITADDPEIEKFCQELEDLAL